MNSVPCIAFMSRKVMAVVAILLRFSAMFFFSICGKCDGRLTKIRKVQKTNFK
jgi:hypothetical protein